MADQLICYSCGVGSKPSQIWCAACGRRLEYKKYDTPATSGLLENKKARKPRLSALARQRYARILELTPAVGSIMLVVIVMLRSHIPEGTELGVYTIDLPVGYSVPLTAQKPTQAEFSSGEEGDVRASRSSDEILPINGSRLVGISRAKGQPTYRNCSSSAIPTGKVTASAGASFCLLERRRLIVGVKILSFSPSKPSFITLRIKVWQG